MEGRTIAGQKSLPKHTHSRRVIHHQRKIATHVATERSVPALSYQAWVHRLHKFSQNAKRMAREAPGPHHLPPVQHITHTTTAPAEMPLEWLLHLHRTSLRAQEHVNEISELSGTVLDRSTGTPLVPVTFKLQYHCSFGQNLYIVGIDSSLGSWDVDKAVALEWNEGHVWTAKVMLEAGRCVEYKYLVKNADGSVARWQEAANVVLDLQDLPATQKPQHLTLFETWCKSQRSFQWHTQATGPAGEASSMGLVSASSYTVKQLQPGEALPDDVHVEHADDHHDGDGDNSNGGRALLEVVAAAAAYSVSEDIPAEVYHNALSSAADMEALTRKKPQSAGAGASGSGVALPGFARALVSVKRTVKLLRTKGLEAVGRIEGKQRPRELQGRAQEQSQPHVVYEVDIPTTPSPAAAAAAAAAAATTVQQETALAAPPVPHDAVSVASEAAAVMRQQCLAAVMLELQRSMSIAQALGDPCHPDLLLADRRLAAASRELAAVTSQALPL